MESHNTSPNRITFAFLVMLAGIASSLFHELGHCIFYWVQGIPAAFSFMKEFPLRDLTAREFAIGSTGGPVFSLLLLSSSYIFQQKCKQHSPVWVFLSTVLLAGVFYCILRSLVALIKGSGEELELAASLMNTNYFAIVAVLLGTMAVVMYLWIRSNAIRVSLKNALYFGVLFALYTLTMATVQSIDHHLFWHRFPTVQIDDGTKYNEMF